MSFTKNWLFQKKYIGSHLSEYTHLLLSGGKVEVPQEDFKTLCKYYAKDVIQGNPNFITEIRTPIFKFHMDIDLLETHEIDLDTIIEYCKAIQECIKQFISWKTRKTSKRLMMVISISPEQNKTKNQNDFIKYGIHLNWPYLKVNTYMAAFLREACIQFLTNKYGQRHEDNTWEDVIDKTVYTNNGLRWIFSDKAETCPDCRGKRKKTKDTAEDAFICCVCQNSGKVPTNRLYEPICILNENNEMMANEFKLLTTKEFNHVLKCVELLSIKCFDLECNIEINEPFPSWYKVVDVVLKTKFEKKTKKKETNPIVRENLSETGEIKKTFCILEQILEDDKRYHLIEEFIENFLPDDYEDANIIEILYCGKKNSKYRSYIVRTDSRYCQNIQDDHNSNHIYFVITPERFHQRCFCSCDVVRPSGIKCMNFIDKGKILSTKLKTSLFPESLDILNEKREQIKYNPNHMLETNSLSNMMEEFGKYF